jgi:hypothetical protein
MTVKVTCCHCKETSNIQMTPDKMASWFAAGKREAPNGTDEQIWEALKNSVVCPDCVEEHPLSAGSFAIGCECGKCGQGGQHQ